MEEHKYLNKYFETYQFYIKITAEFEKKDGCYKFLGFGDIQDGTNQVLFKEDIICTDMLDTHFNEITEYEFLVAVEQFKNNVKSFEDKLNSL